VTQYLAASNLKLKGLVQAGLCDGIGGCKHF